MTNSDPLLTTAFVGEIGVARDDITPPVGIYARNWGAASGDVAEGIHRPLTLTVIAFSSGDAGLLVLIEADLGWWGGRELEPRLRRRVLETFSLDESRVLFCLAHTHAGPGLRPENSELPGGGKLAPYFDSLESKLVDACRAAISSRRRARLTWRYGRCSLATNRDRLQPGTPRYVVGYNPEVEADDTLLVGRVCDAASQRIVATLVNYACHPTTLAWENRLISPDFPGAMREMVEAATEAPCLFLQGASGDLAPAEQYTGDTTVADRHGRRLGHAVLAVLESWPDALLRFERVVESGAPLAVMRPAAIAESSQLAAVRVPVPLTLKALPALAEIEDALAGCSDRLQCERLQRQWGVRRSVGDGAVSTIPLWIWRIGEAVVVAHPNEAYSCFQQELRSKFHPRPLIVCNLVNGSIGYLPPAAHYSRDAYAVTQTPFAVGGLERVTAAAESAVANLIDGAPR